MIARHDDNRLIRGTTRLQGRQDLTKMRIHVRDRTVISDPELLSEPSGEGVVPGSGHRVFDHTRHPRRTRRMKPG